ncbi:MAG: alpha-hydroxy acid oxidase [Acidimicrobiales bacterium]|jgi:isopentenyl diphosphate isomerase/L-lactate dehydrogenase-like FMN-dependent dehydrogenase
MDYWERYSRFAQRRAAVQIANVDDARRRARRRLPRAVFDYIDGGAGAEYTLRANRAVLEQVHFRPRVGETLGVPDPRFSTSVLGFEVTMPVLMSPIGYTRMMNPRGDIAGARAACKAGTVFTLSSMTGHQMDEVVAASTGPAWFQLYFLGGRPGAEQLLDRAKKAGFGALVVTLDTQITGNREREARNRLSPPLKLDLPTILKMAPQVARRPAWLVDLARDRFQLELVNAATLGDPLSPLSVQDVWRQWEEAPPRWEDFVWLREQWQGPILAKGVVTGDDARRAIDAGADAVIVSNHGGRQLDSLPGALVSLAEVVDAVGKEVEVLVDGGFRRGQDVVKAIAIGARAVMIGRAWAYALAAGGEPAVERVLALFRADIDRTLRLLGCASLADLDRSYVQLPASW